MEMMICVAEADQLVRSVWLAQIPFLYMHPNNLRYLFITKSILIPICFIAMLIWAFRSTGGTGGPLLSSTAKATVGGSAYSYAWLSSLTSVSLYHGRDSRSER